MITERKEGVYTLLTIVQSLGLLISLYGWFLTWRYFGNQYTGTWYPWGILDLEWAMVLALTFYSMMNRDAEATNFMGSPSNRITLSLRQGTAATLGVILFLFGTKGRGLNESQMLSRLFVVTFIPVIFISIGLVNAFFPKVIMRLFFSGRSREKCLLITWNGMSKIHLTKEQKELQIHKLHHWLNRQKSYGVDIIGILTNNPKTPKLLDIPHLGPPEDVNNALKSTRATSLIMMERPPQSNIFNYCIDCCEKFGARYALVEDLLLEFGRPSRTIVVDGVNMLLFRVEPLQNPIHRIIKRLSDIVISSLVILFILPPICLVVFIVQCIVSPGPLFFRQQRCGMNKHSFQVLKFRTMHVHKHDESIQAEKNDRRVYKGGGFFRRSSIDEFPQFINVFTGQMSVVGPRPHMLEHDERWAMVLKNYHARTAVKPGITGLAQVRGFRGEAFSDHEILKRVECDVEYIVNWNIYQDLLIILRTAKQVFFPLKNAY